MFIDLKRILIEFNYMLSDFKYTLTYLTRQLIIFYRENLLRYIIFHFIIES